MPTFFGSSLRHWIPPLSPRLLHSLLPGPALAFLAESANLLIATSWARLLLEMQWAACAWRLALGGPFAGKLALLPSMNGGGAGGEEGPGECWEIGNGLAGGRVEGCGGVGDDNTRGPPLLPTAFL